MSKVPCVPHGWDRKVSPRKVNIKGEATVSSVQCSGRDKFRQLDSTLQSKLANINHEIVGVNNKALKQLEVLQDGFDKFIVLLMEQNRSCSDLLNKIWKSTMEIHTLMLDQMSVSLRECRFLIEEKTSLIQQLKSELGSRLSKDSSLGTNFVKNTKQIELELKRNLEEEIAHKDRELLELNAIVSEVKVWYPNFSKYGATILSRYLPPVSINNEYICEEDGIDIGYFQPVSKPLLSAATKLFFEQANEVDKSGDSVTLAQGYLLKDLKRLELLGIGMNVSLELPSMLRTEGAGNAKRVGSSKSECNAIENGSEIAIDSAQCMDLSKVADLVNKITQGQDLHCDDREVLNNLLPYIVRNDSIAQRKVEAASDKFQTLMLHAQMLDDENKELKRKLLVDDARYLQSQKEWQLKMDMLMSTSGSALDTCGLLTQRCTLAAHLMPMIPRSLPLAYPTPASTQIDCVPFSLDLLQQISLEAFFGFVAGKLASIWPHYFSKTCSSNSASERCEGVDLDITDNFGGICMPTLDSTFLEKDFVVGLPFGTDIVFQKGETSVATGIFSDILLKYFSFKLRDGVLAKQHCSEVLHSIQFYAEIYQINQFDALPPRKISSLTASEQSMENQPLSISHRMIIRIFAELVIMTSAPLNLKGVLRNFIFSNLYLKFFSVFKAKLKAFLWKLKLGQLDEDSCRLVDVGTLNRDLQRVFHVVDSVVQPFGESDTAEVKSSVAEHCSDGDAVSNGSVELKSTHMDNRENNPLLMKHKKKILSKFRRTTPLTPTKVLSSPKALTTPWWVLLPSTYYRQLLNDIQHGSKRLGGKSFVDLSEIILLSWNTILRLHAQLKSILTELFRFFRSLVVSGPHHKYFHTLLAVFLEINADHLQAFSSWNASSSVSLLHPDLAVELVKIDAEVYANIGIESTREDVNKASELSAELFADAVLRTRSPLIVTGLLEYIEQENIDEPIGSMDELKQSEKEIWFEKLKQGKQLYRKLKFLRELNMDPGTSTEKSRDQRKGFQRGVLLSGVLADNLKVCDASTFLDISEEEEGNLIDRLLLQAELCFDEKVHRGVPPSKRNILFCVRALGGVLGILRFHQLIADKLNGSEISTYSENDLEALHHHRRYILENAFHSWASLTVSNSFIL